MPHHMLPASQQRRLWHGHKGQPYHTTHCPLRSHAVFGMATKGDHATPHAACFEATQACYGCKQ
eukprot:360142-Chlamydomonas_euryale.AAC.6